MGLDSRIGRMGTHPRPARSPRRSRAAPGVQPKVGDEPGGGQAGDLAERAGLFEQVSDAPARPQAMSGGQPSGLRSATPGRCRTLSWFATGSATPW
jgi:hypothetical protein